MYKLSEHQKSTLAGEAHFQYSRSSGPGGQKVNKTETRAELRWEFLSSSLLNEDQKNLIQFKLKNRINKSNELLVYSDQFRTRLANQKQCLLILEELLEKALTVQRPRKKTKPSRSSVEKRITDKKRMGEKKKNRQKF